MFSRKSQYALRALLFLAHQQKDGRAWLGVSEIAGETGIPKKWLSGIFIELKDGGLVRSHRGKRGGYSLQESPDKVTVLQILSITELKERKSYILSDLNGSKSGQGAGGNDLIQPVVHDLLDARTKILNRTTLAELIRKKLQ